MPDLGPYPELTESALELLGTADLRLILQSAEARILAGRGDEVDDLVARAALNELQRRAVNDG